MAKKQKIVSKKRELDKAVYKITTKALEDVGKVALSPKHINADVLTDIREKYHLTMEKSKDNIKFKSDNIMKESAGIKIGIAVRDEDDVALEEVDRQLRLRLLQEELKKEMSNSKSEGITPQDDKLLQYILAHLDRQLEDKTSDMALYAAQLEKKLEQGDTNYFFSPEMKIKVDDIINDLMPEKKHDRAEYVKRIYNSFFVLTYPVIPIRVRNVKEMKYENKYNPLIRFNYAEILNDDDTIEYDAIYVSFNAAFILRPTKGGVTLNSLNYLINSKYNSVLRVTLNRMILLRRGWRTTWDKAKNKEKNKEGSSYNGEALTMYFTVGQIIEELGVNKKIYLAQRSDTKDLSIIDDEYLKPNDVKRKNSANYRPPKEYRRRASTEFRKSLFEGDLIKSLNDMQLVGLIDKYNLPKENGKIKWKKPYTDTAFSVTIKGKGWLKEQNAIYNDLDDAEVISGENVPSQNVGENTNDAKVKSDIDAKVKNGNRVNVKSNHDANVKSDNNDKSKHL